MTQDIKIYIRCDNVCETYFHASEGHCRPCKEDAVAWTKMEDQTKIYNREN